MKESMNYMFEAGFLGTRAPFFMDFVTLIVAFLPIIIFASIMLARKKHYKLHAISQNIIFIAAVVVLGYFELGVRVGGGFDAFIEGSGVSHTYASITLGLHIIIALVMLFYWILTVLNANVQFFRGLIPGVQSRSHKLLAAKTFIAIIFTSFSGIWVYLLLFVY
jgi:putative membrane protein